MNSFEPTDMPNENEQAVISIVQHAKQLACQHEKNRLKPIPIIAIGGSKGSGKSFFSLMLQKLLQKEGAQVTIIKQNGFLLHDDTADQALINVDPRLKWKELHNVFTQIESGQTNVLIPKRDPSTHPSRIITTLENFSTIDLILFDGFFALSGPETFNFFSRCAFGIFIETSQENMYRWLLQRHRKKPIQFQKTQEQFDQDFATDIKKYTTYILPTKKNAMFIIHKDENHRYTVTEQDVKSHNH